MMSISRTLFRFQFCTVSIDHQAQTMIVADEASDSPLLCLCWKYWWLRDKTKLHITKLIWWNPNICGWRRSQDTNQNLSSHILFHNIYTCTSLPTRGIFSMAWHTLYASVYSNTNATEMSMTSGRCAVSHQYTNTHHSHQQLILVQQLTLWSTSLGTKQHVQRGPHCHISERQGLPYKESMAVGQMTLQPT